MTTTAKPKVASTERKIEQRWGTPLTKAGWTAIPNVIFQRQKALGLTPLDITILLQLAAYWWEPDDLPRPSKKTVADTIGVHPRTVQKRIAAMETAKFIQRIPQKSKAKGNNPNLYDFSGLIAAAIPFAQEELQEIEHRTHAKAAKLARKKPKLAAVQ
jgi:hypothetical protein